MLKNVAKYTSMQHKFSYNSIPNPDANLFGIDPENDLEINFVSQPDCNYYSAYDFHLLCQKQNKNRDGAENLSILHTNIQSLMHNFEDLETLVNDLGQKFHIIALSETWNSTEKKNRFRPGILSGYHQYAGISGTTIKSGCGLYIRDDLKYFERDDLSCSVYDEINEFQYIFFEIINQTSRNYLIGVCYRHPKKNSNEKFINSLSATLQILNRENKLTVIAGDFNYDLLKIEKTPYCKDFIDVMYSNFFQPSIILPTRCLPNYKPSLIDNIFTNCLDKKSLVEISQTLSLTKCPIFCLLTHRSLQKAKQNIFT